MNRDPNYDRYSGIVSLPGDPLNPSKPQLFRVDEEGNVIYVDKELNAGGPKGEEKPIKLAELGNSDWNGYEPMRAQGLRDGRNLRKHYEDFDRNTSAPTSDGTYSAPLARPSVGMMAEATNDAFNTVWGGYGAPGLARGLNTDFSRVDSLPDFSKGNWKKVYSTHASEAYEHALPGSSGMAVKVYLKDREHDGLNTATITAPTESIDHYGSWPAYMMGLPVNSRNAAMYLADQRAQRKARK